MTDGVRIKLLDRRHVGDLAALLADPDVLRFTRVPEPAPENFATTWYDRYEAGRRDGTSEAFAAVDGAGTFLGIGLAPRVERAARQLEIGYIVAPAARGRGIGTALLAHVTRWAFEQAGALRAYLIIDVRNAPSQRVAERSGYTLEGVMRSLHLKQDVRIDAQLWSRLASDR